MVDVEDRALVAALVAGEPRGLEGAYRAYADRLYTYCRGQLRDPDQAADAVHDTFVLAGQRAGQLRDPDRLRSWLYAIARNECLRMLRGRSRQVPLAEADQMSADTPDPTTQLRAAELQELVRAAAEGLNPGERDVFELTVRHELTAVEVSEALGVSLDHAHARLSRVRSHLERALGALLVARTGREECPELDALLHGWDGRLTALVRKRVGRHVESCDICQERQRQQLSPAALFSAYAAVPFLVAPAELWPRLQLTSFDPGGAAAREAITRRVGRFEPGTGFPRPLDVRRRRARMAGVAAVAVAALLAAGAGALIPPALPAADQPGSLPTAVAIASPTPPAALPTPAPSSMPTSPSPGADSPEPPPPAGSTATPPLSPSPLPPSPTPTPSGSPRPLTVDAEADVNCLERATYTLVVRATASRPLASAVLFVVVGRETRTYRMAVDGPSAVGETERLPTSSPAEWWVVVTDQGRESARSVPAQVVRPCST